MSKRRRLGSIINGEGRRRAHFSPSPHFNDMSRWGGGGEEAFRGFSFCFPHSSGGWSKVRACGTHTLTVSSGTPGARFLTLRQVENRAVKRRGAGGKVNKVMQHRKDLLIPSGDMKIEQSFFFFFLTPSGGDREQCGKYWRKAGKHPQDCLWGENWVNTACS